MKNKLLMLLALLLGASNAWAANTGKVKAAKVVTPTMTSATGNVDFLGSVSIESSATVKSSMTASAFFGDGAHVTNVTAIGVSASAIDTTALATDAVTAVKLINAAVQTAKLATDAVTASAILNATITTAKFAAGAVDTNAMQTDAVSNAKILNNAVQTSKIAADAVTATSILNATITGAKLAASTVNTTNIAHIVNSGAGTAGDMVVLGSDGKLPAVNGANLTNITASGITGGMPFFVSSNNGTTGTGVFSPPTWVNTSVVISTISVIITTDGEGGSTGTVWKCCNGTPTCLQVTSAASAAVGTTYTATGVVAVSALDSISISMSSTDETVTPSATVQCGCYK